MFGFGNRKKYNGSVDTKLNREYQIETRGNPYFPSFSQYVEVLEKTFNSGLSEDDAALYVAILYYSVMLDGCMYEEANKVLGRIKAVGVYNIRIGVFSQERWDRFYTYVEDAQVKYMQGLSSQGASEDEPETPESLLETALFEIQAYYGFDMGSFSARKEFEDFYYQTVRDARISRVAYIALIQKLVALSVLSDGADRRMKKNPVAKGDLAWTLELIESSEELAPKDSYDGKTVSSLIPTIYDDIDILLSYFGFK